MQLGLVSAVNLDLGTTLIATGFYNVYSGFAFGVPMPVQPMKSIAAVAITENGIDLTQVMLAGILVSSIVLFLGVTGLVQFVRVLVPGHIIRGIQLGLGLKLASTGLQMVLFENSKGGDFRGWLGSSGLLLGLIATAFVAWSVITPLQDPPTPRSDPSEREAAPLEVPPTCSSAFSHEGDALSGSLPALADASRTVHVDIDPSRPDAKHAASLSGDAMHAASLPGDAVGGALQTANSKSEYARAGSGSALEGESSRTSSWEGGAAPLVAGSSDKGASNASGGWVQRVRTVWACVPVALLVVLVGVCVTLVSDPSVAARLSFGPSTPQLISPQRRDWWVAFERAALPQIPVTLLNSVVAVTLLSEELFPEQPISDMHVAASVGFMNLVGCWFGVMPACHGAGGLAAQARFGARSGTAPLLLGLLKIALGLLFGSSLYQLLKEFPPPLLGALLIISGSELAAMVSKQTGKRQWLLLLITAAGSFAKDTSMGFFVGCAATIVTTQPAQWKASARQVQQWWANRRRGTESLMDANAHTGVSSLGDCFGADGATATSV